MKVVHRWIVQSKWLFVKSCVFCFELTLSMHYLSIYVWKPHRESATQCTLVKAKYWEEPRPPQGSWKTICLHIVSRSHHECVALNMEYVKPRGSPCLLILIEKPGQKLENRLPQTNHSHTIYIHHPHSHIIKPLPWAKPLYISTILLAIQSLHNHNPTQKLASPITTC